MSTGVTSSGASLLRTSLVSLPLETHNFKLKLLSSDDFPETFVEMLALDTEGMRWVFKGPWKIHRGSKCFRRREIWNDFKLS